MDKSSLNSGRNSHTKEKGQVSSSLQPRKSSRPKSAAVALIYKKKSFRQAKKSEDYNDDAIGTMPKLINNLVKQNDA